MGKLSFVVAALAVLRLMGHFTDPTLSSAEIRRVVGEPTRIMAAGNRHPIDWVFSKGFVPSHPFPVAKPLKGDT